MRRNCLTLAALLMFAFALSTHARAQAEVFTDENLNYKLELPSATWRVIGRPDGLQQRAEFIYGDRLDGYLQVHKEIVDAGVTPADLAQGSREDKLRFKPGYVDGKEEKFTGRLNGLAMSYEYTYAGKPMLGRIYFLQVDTRTIYVLHFTGLRDKLARIRNQTDAIARSLTMK